MDQSASKSPDRRPRLRDEVEIFTERCYRVDRRSINTVGARIRKQTNVSERRKNSPT